MTYTKTYGDHSYTKTYDHCGIELSVQYDYCNGAIETPNKYFYPDLCVGCVLKS